MSIPFTKMHGCGNDYVFVDTGCATIEDPVALAIAVSDRHTGIGSDGLILIDPAGQDAHLAMRMFNADGSVGRMCGNGIRCVCKYAYERGLCRARPMRIATASGTVTLDYQTSADDLVVSVSVDMGAPILTPRDIPVDDPRERLVNIPDLWTDQPGPVTCVSMGNPHAVCFVDDLDAVDLAAIGPQIEHLSIFPERVNLHLARIDTPSSVTMRTWERGSGLTRACGTGACAVCVAGVLTGRTSRTITTHLPGGDLEINWDEQTSRITMTGPAVEVYTGVWPTAS